MSKTNIILYKALAILALKMQNQLVLSSYAQQRALDVICASSLQNEPAENVIRRVLLMTRAETRKIESLPNHFFSLYATMLQYGSWFHTNSLRLFSGKLASGIFSLKCRFAYTYKHWSAEFN